MPKTITEIRDDDLVEYGRQFINETRRRSYAAHPERVLRNRVCSAAHLLHREGYIDDEQHDAILTRAGGGAA